jgi:predicted RNA-binding protein
VQPENVPWQIYRACSDPDGNVNVATYEMLHTRIDMGGLADILEMRDVHDSWAAAAMRNADSQAGR